MSQVERCRICGSNGIPDQFSAVPPLEYAYCCENISGCGIIGPSNNTPEEARILWNELMMPTLWTLEALSDVLGGELENLLAMVQGECPSLLRDSHSWETISDALEAWRNARKDSK